MGDDDHVLYREAVVMPDKSPALVSWGDEVLGPYVIPDMSILLADLNRIQSREMSRQGMGSHDMWMIHPLRLLKVHLDAYTSAMPHLSSSMLARPHQWIVDALEHPERLGEREALSGYVGVVRDGVSVAKVCGF